MQHRAFLHKIPKEWMSHQAFLHCMQAQCWKSRYCSSIHGMPLATPGFTVVDPAFHHAETESCLKLAHSRAKFNDAHAVEASATVQRIEMGT